jgi:hypothetical protein
MIAIDSGSPEGFEAGNEERALDREFVRFSNKVSRGVWDCASLSLPIVDSIETSGVRQA